MRMERVAYVEVSHKERAKWCGQSLGPEPGPRGSPHHLRLGGPGSRPRLAGPPERPDGVTTPVTEAGPARSQPSVPASGTVTNMMVMMMMADCKALLWIKNIVNLKSDVSKLKTDDCDRHRRKLFEISVLCLGCGSVCTTVGICQN